MLGGHEYAIADRKQRGREPGVLTDGLAELVTYIHRRCATDMLEIVGRLELSISQVKALHHLDLLGPRTLGELAGQIHLSPAATGRAVEDMQRMGLVERSAARRPSPVTSPTMNSATTSG